MTLKRMERTMIRVTHPAMNAATLTAIDQRSFVSFRTSSPAYSRTQTAYAVYNVSQRNVPRLAYFNFDTRSPILICFGTNVAVKVGNQKTLYYATSNNLCFCTDWENEETRKLHSIKCCIRASSDFNQLLLDFFNLVDSRLILTLLYDSLNLVINAFSSGLLAWFRRN